MHRLGWTAALSLTLACSEPAQTVRHPADAGARPAPVAASACPASGPDFGVQFADAAQIIRPSLVAISANGLASRGARALNLQGTPLAFLLRGLATDTAAPPHGIGSGVIVDDSGTILTNDHVVEGEESVRVRLADGREADAKVIGMDARSDLAVLRLSPDTKSIQPAKLGDSDKLQVGQWVMACGMPFGSGQNVSVGVLSALGRGSAGIAEHEDFIQTDAVLNSVNSGGPLVDRTGEVIGINAAVGGPANGNAGFVIPVNMARNVMAQLVERGKVVRGDIGVYVSSVSRELALSFGYHGEGGALVQDVNPESPAARADIKPGDILIELDGTPLENATALRNAVASSAPGATLKLKLSRDGKTRETRVEVGELQELTPSAGPPGASSQLVWGVELSDVTPELRERLKLRTASGAVVVQVSPNSPADDAGLRPGDILASVGDSEVVDADQARRLLLTAKSPVRLRLIHDGRGAFVILPAPH